MRPPCALPAAHFDRNESAVIHGIGHKATLRLTPLTPHSVWLRQNLFAPRRPLQRKSTVCGLNSCLPRLINSRGTYHLNPQPVSFLAALAPSVLLQRVALLALRFRLGKYAQHTFSTETECRKNSGSSQSLASLLRLTEPTNQNQLT